MKPGCAVETSSTAGVEGGRRVGSDLGEYGRSIASDGHAVGTGGGSEGGFQGLLFMLRSLGSPMQVKPNDLRYCSSRRAVPPPRE